MCTAESPRPEVVCDNHVVPFSESQSTNVCLQACAHGSVYRVQSIFTQLVTVSGFHILEVAEVVKQSLPLRAQDGVGGT